MSVILGSEGYVHLQRFYGQPALNASVGISNVAATRDSFVFNWGDPLVRNPFITGDKVRIDAQGGDVLEWITGTPPGGTWFVNVDQLGGIRLYPTFKQAVQGEDSGLVNIVTPSKTVQVRCGVEDATANPLGAVRSYELNTSRDMVDTTALGDEFKNTFGTLISGSGKLTCFFDYQARMCDPMLPCDDTEVSIYYHQLILRAQLGSQFRGIFVVVAEGNKPFGDASDTDDVVFYDVMASVSNVGIAVEPTQPLMSSIDFVTTGEIKLRVATKKDIGYLLQQGPGTNKILLQQGTGVGALKP